MVIRYRPLPASFQGTHPSLRGSSKALATVTSIIDGTGSVGAAIGPFLAGAIHGLDNIFYMLMAADVCALLVSPHYVSLFFLQGDPSG